MARKAVTDIHAWPSLSLEGNLIAPAMIGKIARQTATKQALEDYGVRRGLVIGKEILTAFHVGQSHFDTVPNPDALSQDATRRFISGFLKETFGFDDLGPAEAPIALIAGDRIPVVVVPSSEPLDRRSSTLSVDGPRSPAFALQDYLNDKEEALWGLVTNGIHLRLMRDNASLTRPAYIEADLTQIFLNKDIASFAILWLLIHRSRFGPKGTPATNCVLERWRDEGLREGEAIRGRLSEQVETALKILGSGFLEANSDLVSKLKSGEVKLTGWFNELLNLVYRLVFLMVAEDKNLLHPPRSRAEARELYQQGYSLATLRRQCQRAATWNRHQDRYEGIKVVFRALDQGQGKEALALPAFGGLFAADKLHNLESARLRNRDFMKALYHLSWFADTTGAVPINWRLMESEELGSVYETLLEFQPQLSDDCQRLLFASEAVEIKGNQRKSSGSYYTPNGLVKALLDTTLDPVIKKVEAEAQDPVRALLKISVIDPACGSGHFLLAAARRLAVRLARLRAEGTPDPEDFRHALRDVVRRCIYGVDLNPMAVELTKVALWIETMDPSFPLGFLDAQLRCGDSLLGIFDIEALEGGIPDAAYKPLTGDDKDTCKYYLKANRDAKSGQSGLDFGSDQADMLVMKPLALDFSDFRDLPEDTVEQIGDKAARLKKLHKKRGFVRPRGAADLYIAAFLLLKVDGVPAGASARTVPTTQELQMALNQGKIWKAMEDAPRVARRAHAFHWPLEFPDVMQRGGFDVVLGNPPWGKIKLSEEKFFATRDPEIANAGNKAARGRMIEALREAESGIRRRALFAEFKAAKRQSEAISTFVRVPSDDGGRFPFTGTGDVNTYALFAELFLRLLGNRGRAGVILPTGIATDATTAPFFAHLVEEKRLASLLDFENTAPIFPAVDSRFKFCLLTLGPDEPEAHFAFFLTKTSQLAEAERSFTLSPEQTAAINPNTRTSPVFRSRADAELTAKIYRNAPVLITESKGGTRHNPWGLNFSRMFDMSNDSGLFRRAANLEADGSIRDGADWVAGEEGSAQWDMVAEGGEPYEPGRYVPLYEAKMLHQFDHRWAGYDAQGA